MAGSICVMLPSCNGMFDDVYDSPAPVSAEFGFVEVSADSTAGTIYINATDYRRWTYINFHNKTIDSLNIAEGMTEPDGWDIAIHRYDTKTNGGAALETSHASLDELLASGAIPVGTYVEDVWTENVVITDMSQMADGHILYAHTYYNKELSKWLNVDTSVMPPAYTMPDKVYVVRLNDGTHAALRLISYMNAAGVKGYMRINYIYPLEKRLP